MTSEDKVIYRRTPFLNIYRDYKIIQSDPGSQDSSWHGAPTLCHLYSPPQSADSNWFCTHCCHTKKFCQKSAVVYIENRFWIDEVTEVAQKKVLKLNFYVDTFYHGYLEGKT